MGDELTLEELANNLRAEIKPIELVVRKMQEHSFFLAEKTWGGQHEEIETHIDLCIRHLEDARMRLGKVLQYLNPDQKSVYDK